MKPIARLFAILAVLGLLLPLLAACGESAATPTTAAPAATTGTGVTDTTPAGGAATATTTGAGAMATTATGGAATATTATGNTTAPASGALLSTGCGQAATYLRNFNPFRATAPLFPTLYGIYEPLMVYNSIKGEIVPWLADKYAWSTDNKTLTFTLHDGVQWSDGQPFTAKDVVFTFDLLKKTGGLSGPGLATVAGPAAYVDSVTAPDDKTVVFAFKQVFAPGLYDIIYQVIVPEHIWKDVADPVKFTNDNPVGTGPFTEVTNFQPQVYEVGRNPHYWQAGKPAIQGIRCPAYAANDQMNLKLANGELDWAAGGFPNIESVYVAKDSANRGYWFAAAGGIVAIDLNTTKKPFDDANVRKAISMAINRDQITKVAVYGYVPPADVTGLSGAFPQLKVADPSKLGDWTTYNPTKANQLLDAAGLKKGADGLRTLPDGTKMDYKLSVASGFAIHIAAAGIIVQQLKAVGINVTLAQADTAGWQDRLLKGNYDMSMAITGFTGPANFYSAYRTQMSASATAPIGQIATGGNYSRYVSTKGDALLAQYAGATDPAQQKQIAEQLQQVFADEAPNIPIYPSPLWYEYNTTRFTGFPTKDNAYALGSYGQILSPEQLIVMTTIKPK
jgi:peptide/nickel transport system substrate-binding protein